MAMFDSYVKLPAGLFSVLVNERVLHDCNLGNRAIHSVFSWYISFLRTNSIVMFNHLCLAVYIADLALQRTSVFVSGWLQNHSGSAFFW